MIKFDNIGKTFFIVHRSVRVIVWPQKSVLTKI